MKLTLVKLLGSSLENILVSIKYNFVMCSTFQFDESNKEEFVCIKSVRHVKVCLEENQLFCFCNGLVHEASSLLSLVRF